MTLKIGWCGTQLPSDVCCGSLCSFIVGKVQIHLRSVIETEKSKIYGIIWYSQRASLTSLSCSKRLFNYCNCLSLPSNQICEYCSASDFLPNHVSSCLCLLPFSGSLLQQVGQSKWCVGSAALSHIDGCVNRQQSHIDCEDFRTRECKCSGEHRWIYFASLYRKIHSTLIYIYLWKYLWHI